MATAACDSGPETPRSKRIYSVLQSEEYQLRQRATNGAYVYVKNAFGSEYDTIAFPLSGNRGEYIVFLANPEERDPIYSVPIEEDAKFLLDEATFQDIAAKKYVAGRLQEHLKRYVAR